MKGQLCLTSVEMIFIWSDTSFYLWAWTNRMVTYGTPLRKIIIYRRSCPTSTVSVHSEAIFSAGARVDWCVRKGRETASQTYSTVWSSYSRLFSSSTYFVTMMDLNIILIIKILKSQSGTMWRTSYLRHGSASQSIVQ